jgi:hypothetical protein
MRDEHHLGGAGAISGWPKNSAEPSARMWPSYRNEASYANPPAELRLGRPHDCLVRRLVHIDVHVGPHERMPRPVREHVCPGTPRSVRHVRPRLSHGGLEGNLTRRHAGDGQQGRQLQYQTHVRTLPDAPPAGKTARPSSRFDACSNGSPLRFLALSSAIGRAGGRMHLYRVDVGQPPVLRPVRDLRAVSSYGGTGHIDGVVAELAPSERVVG